MVFDYVYFLTFMVFLEHFTTIDFLAHKYLVKLYCIMYIYIFLYESIFCEDFCPTYNGIWCCRSFVSTAVYLLNIIKGY